ncbi:MAG: cell division protein SepF [Firmicutes bacterium]|uniref:Cell division protein SepF n=1 Tax=Candidatus Scybalomonas excrementavium TaxID=2840943 RepID=A0A9D9HY23_9FIRM|nr:cell division protein SepF [Candidatus Scybalomonas excrementavium]
MSKGINKFLDLMKLNEPEDDYDDDDLMEDDDYEDEEDSFAKSFFNRNKEKSETTIKAETAQPSSFADKKKAKALSKSKLVPLSGGRGGEVYVIKPQEFNEAQVVADFLKDGKTIVINMEGIEIYAAQRIIDFISGSCYALNGTLQAISSNIFIAAPEAIEVAGDLREEILNENLISPEIGKYRV